MKLIVQETTAKNIITGVIEKRADIMLASDNGILINKKNILMNDGNIATLDIAKNLYSIGHYDAVFETLSKLKNEFESFKNKEEYEFVNQFVKLDPNYKLNLTYKGVAIPQPIVDKMRTCKTQEEALRIHRFYLKCLDNPNPDSVKDLFLFIQNSKLIITPSGNFVTFRRILSRKKISDVAFNLLKQISNTLITNPNVNLFGKIENDNLILTDEASGKSIRDLIKEVGSNTHYTDNHTKTYDYKIGHTYVENNYDSNHNNTCSSGLHSGSIYYVESNTFCGDTIVWCIVDPTKVVAVSDQASKVRSSELYIGGIVPCDLTEFAEKLSNGSICVDMSDEEYEKKYEGRVIAYNTCKADIPELAEDDYEEDYDDLEDDQDYLWLSDEEIERMELEEENETLKEENKKLKSELQRMIEEIKCRFNLG